MEYVPSFYSFIIYTPPCFLTGIVTLGRGGGGAGLLVGGMLFEGGGGGGA